MFLIELYTNKKKLINKNYRNYQLLDCHLKFEIIGRNVIIKKKIILFQIPIHRCLSNRLEKLIGLRERLRAIEASNRERRRMRRFDHRVLLLVDEALLLLGEVAPQQKRASTVLLRDELDNSIGEYIPADFRVRTGFMSSKR